MLENGADLHVNERHKIRHYRGRSTEERRLKKTKKNAKSRCLRKLAPYSDVIHFSDWISAVDHDDGV